MNSEFSGLKERLKRLNGLLAELSERLPSRGELREILARRAGRFETLLPMSPGEIRDWAGSRPIMGVDGSSNSFGSGFPHSIYLFQGYARVSGAGARTVSASEVFTPLEPAGFDRVASLARQWGLSNEEAVERLKRDALARVEVEAAHDAALRYEPGCAIFDGGFLRYESGAPVEWGEYRRHALEKGILSVGVIEEVATDLLGRLLAGEVDLGAGPLYDRAVLFGLLDEGECLMLARDVPFKKGYYTVFCRFSSNPQAVGCDFFREQADQVPPMLRFLYTITPRGSRGIPLWLDVVDLETRITAADMELLLDTCLDRGWLEHLFVPQRLRRQF